MTGIFDRLEPELRPGARRAVRAGLAWHQQAGTGWSLGSRGASRRGGRSSGLAHQCTEGGQSSARAAPLGCGRSEPGSRGAGRSGGRSSDLAHRRAGCSQSLAPHGIGRQGRSSDSRGTGGRGGRSSDLACRGQLELGSRGVGRQGPAGGAAGARA